MIETNGNQTVLGETRQFEFWTPSLQTKNYLHRENGEVVPAEKWQVISNDDVLEKFGTLLHANGNVIGYRRVEVWGQGRTAYKPGWWWTVNVATNYSGVDVARAYQSFWKSPSAMFVEMIDNRGSSDN